MASLSAATTRCTRKDPSLCRIHGNLKQDAPANGGEGSIGAVRNDLLEAGELLFNSIVDPRDQEQALKTLNGRDLWLAIPSGSKLYNLATPTSDRDYMFVTAPERTVKHQFSKQSIIGDADFLVTDFPTFVKQAQAGSPRSVEAMFATLPHPTPLDGFRFAFRVSGGEWQHKHRGMVHDAYAKGYDESLPLAKRQKNRRHTLRLLRNALMLGETGQLRPELSAGEVEWVHRVSEGPEDVYEAEVTRLTQMTGMNWNELQTSRDLLT